MRWPCLPSILGHGSQALAACAMGSRQWDGWTRPGQTPQPSPSPLLPQAAPLRVCSHEVPVALCHAIANALEMFAWGGKVLSQVQPPPPGRGAAPHAAWSRGGRKKPPAEGFGEEHPLRVGLWLQQGKCECPELSHSAGPTCSQRPKPRCVGFWQAHPSHRKESPGRSPGGELLRPSAPGCCQLEPLTASRNRQHPAQPGSGHRA